MRTPRYQITEVTPSLCQAIYETSRNTYIVIGKKVDPKKVGLERKVGENELAVEIPRELLENIRKGQMGLEPLLHYFNTEHLSEEVRRKIARRVAEAKKYCGSEERYDYHRYEIEKNIYRAKGDFSSPGRTDESGRSLDGGCDVY